MRSIRMAQLLLDPNRTVVGAQHRAVDHVSRMVAARQFCQRVQQRIEHPGLAIQRR